jgi:hypothetical protein
MLCDTIIVGGRCFQNGAAANASDVSMNATGGIQKKSTKRKVDSLSVLMAEGLWRSVLPLRTSDKLTPVAYIARYIAGLNNKQRITVTWTEFY